MPLVNLTPHTINVMDIAIEPSGTIARCSEETTFAGKFEDIKLVKRVYTDVVNLPEQKEGVMLIVSNLVRMACPDRKDLASPGDAIRKKDGYIIGVTNLIVN